MARQHPGHFVLGIDACRESLGRTSRLAPSNALFLIGNVLTLSTDLEGVATDITINFPWGSLLEGLLDADSGVASTLRLLARPLAALEVRLNAGALAESGWQLQDGVTRIRRSLQAQSFLMDPATELDVAALRQFQSSWSKRLAFGRDPRGILLSGHRQRTLGGNLHSSTGGSPLWEPGSRR